MFFVITIKALREKPKKPSEILYRLDNPTQKTFKKKLRSHTFKEASNRHKQQQEQQPQQGIKINPSRYLNISLTSHTHTQKKQNIKTHFYKTSLSKLFI